MNTIVNAPASWTGNTTNTANTTKSENKLTAFINSQARYETAWFLVSLIVQGVFFLPLPAVLIFNFHAPVIILVLTLGLFFANLIAGMSSSGIKAIIYLFAASVIVNVLLLAFFTLL